jgi:hypothetical protein
MYEFLNNIALLNDWVFEYSRADYQNLYDEMDNGKIHLFVDPIVIDSSFSDSGNETKTYSGKFMLLLSSDVDEDYSTKYNTYIKPLIDNGMQSIKDVLLCSEFQINKLQVVEVINLFDYNLDGVLVNYSVTVND